MNNRKEKPTETDLGPKRRLHPQRIAASKLGMVATQHHLATDAGVEMLEDGGNAIDAAVAAAFALAVCEPAASGLGGQSMILLYLDGLRTIALDGSSRAPNRATPGLLSKGERLVGHRATTVPSTPAALDYCRERYGKLPLARVLEPAIRLAEHGFAVSELQTALTKRELSKLKKGSAAKLFLRDSIKPYRPGAVLRQPALAATLRELAEHGIEEFYTGSIADAIHADMEAHDGLLHRDDLAQIPWPIERRAISCRFEGHRVHTFPPPGAGRTLAQTLKVLSALPNKLRDHDTPDGAVALAEVLRRALVDRRDRPFDPAFYPQVDERRLTDDEYAERIARQIKKRAKHSGETTHLSVMDHDGNTVALTQSIERVYGSFEASPELGFLYNNYMSAFEYKDISHPYYLRPNAAPWASVAPTITFRGRRPYLAIGSPGSERIVSSIAQVLSRLERQAPYEAVAAPRMHCSLKGKVSLEASRMRDDIPVALERRGFTIDVREPWSFYLGCVQLVMRERNRFVGVADPRRDGSARGCTR